METSPLVYSLDRLAVEDTLDLGQLRRREVLVEDLLEALELLGRRHDSFTLKFTSLN